jgi:hypothetical protein
MKFLLQSILICLYPLLVFGGLLNRLRKRDPLRLREPPGETYWIERVPDVSRASYFLEVSEQEGKNHGGCGGLAAVILCWLSRRFAPPRKTSGEDFRATLDRERDIPDEVYTLW